MTIHPTHDFPSISAAAWGCRGCNCMPWSPDAALRCGPVQFDDDPRAAAETRPCDVEDYDLGPC